MFMLYMSNPVGKGENWEIESATVAKKVAFMQSKHYKPLIFDRMV